MKIRQHIHTRKPVHVQMRAAYMPVKKTTIHTILYTLLKKTNPKTVSEKSRKNFVPKLLLYKYAILDDQFLPPTNHPR